MISAPAGRIRSPRLPLSHKDATMPLPYYVSPEQMMQDKAEYARKGIAKGKSIVAL